MAKITLPWQKLEDVGWEGLGDHSRTPTPGAGTRLLQALSPEAPPHSIPRDSSQTLRIITRGNMQPRCGGPGSPGR